MFFVGQNFSYTSDVLTAGGWTIGAGQIQNAAGTAILSGSGVLSIGTGTNAFGSASRIYLDGPLNRASIGENFSFESNVLTAGGWKIGDTQISSSRNTAALISANGGALALGSTLPTSHTSGNGVWISGSGQFLFGNSAGNRLQFNGTQLLIDTDNFDVDAGGNATISGSITAANLNATGTGSIAGWTFDHTAISKRINAGTGTVSYTHLRAHET